MTKKIENIVSQLNNFLNHIMENKNSYVSFIIKYVVICVLALSALFRANFIYVDDYRRVHKGTIDDWDEYSRYLGEFLCKLFDANKVLSDTSPFVQIAVVVLMAISVLMIISAFSKEKISSLFVLIAAISFTINPLFLQNISMKVECIVHGFTTLCSTLPLLFYKKRNFGYSVVVAICMFLMSITYQGATGLFPVLIVLIAADEWNEGEKTKEIVKLIISSVIGYLVGWLAFRVFVMKPVQTHVSSDTLELKDLIPGMIKNYGIYYKALHGYFPKLWEILICMVFLTFCLVFTVRSKNNKIVAFFVSILTLFTCSIACIGIFIILEHLYSVPRRMIVFGFYISILCIYSVIRAGKGWNGFSYIVATALTWCFVVFSFIYGNCLSYQKDYTESRIQMVLNWMNENCDLDEEYELHLDGGIGYAPAIINDMERYPILKTIVPRTLDGTWNWSQYRLYNYYGIPNNITRSWWITSSAAPYDIDEMKLVDELLWFDVYRNDEILLVYFK